MRRLWMAMSVLFVAGLCTSTAAAQFGGDTIRIFAVGELGVGGTVTRDVGGMDVESDMGPSFGVAGGADYGLNSFFAIGGMARWLSINPDAPAGVPAALANGLDERHSVVDFAVYPRLRLPLPIIELYAMTPVGISFLSPPGDREGKTGFTAGLYGGAQVGLLPLLSLVGQVGWSHHGFSGVSFGEMTINVGLALGI